MKYLFVSCLVLLMSGCIQVAKFKDADNEFVLIDTMMNEKCVCGSVVEGTVSLGGLAAYFTDIEVSGKGVKFASVGRMCTLGQVKEACDKL